MSYTVRPENHELEEARRSVEGAIESCKYVLSKEKDLEINLGVSSDERRGAHGLAESEEVLQLFFNPEIDGWSEQIGQTAVNCYGEAWIRENKGSIDFVWEKFLASVTGLLLLEKTGESREIDGDFSDEWVEKEGKLESMLSPEAHEDFPWQIKARIGEELLEKHELQDFPGLTLSDVRKAGEKAFD